MNDALPTWHIHCRPCTGSSHRAIAQRRKSTNQQLSEVIKLPHIHLPTCQFTRRARFTNHRQADNRRK